MPPASSGSFDTISNVVDPKLHTAAMMGWLDNSDGRLRIGQFITATVDLPTAPDEVAIPEGSILDEGPGSIVFVSPDSSARRVTRRTVAVIRREQNVVFVRTHPTEEETAAGCQPLLPGDYVVTGGTVSLAGALDAAIPAGASPSDQGSIDGASTLAPRASDRFPGQRFLARTTTVARG